MRKTQLDLEIGIDRARHKEILTTIRANQKTVNRYCPKCRKMETFSIIGLILETRKNSLKIKYY